MKVTLAVGAFLLPLLAQASALVDRDIAAASGISTTSGLIVGHAAVNRTGVTEYLGISYAASTNGSQRWMPPRRFTSKKTFNASIYVSISNPPLTDRGNLLITTTHDAGAVCLYSIFKLKKLPELTSSKELSC
jgi:hypothetical protein